MKKLLFILCAISAYVSLYAQRIEFVKNNEYFTVVSPNGRYFAGTQDAQPFYHYDIEASEDKLFVVETPEEVSDHAYFVSGISNTGMVVGQLVDKAAYYQRPDESWTLLPIPAEITGDLAKVNNATAISPDGEMITVSFGDFNSTNIYVYEKDADAENGWKMTKLPVADVDPVYHQGAQWIKIVAISADKNQMLAQWLIDWGNRVMPVLYTRSENTWNYEFICQNNILIEGKTISDMPEAVWSDELEDWVYNQNELNKYQQSWSEAEAGYFVPGSPFSVSPNFKYFTLNWGDNSKEESGIVPAFASVYDTENRKMYNFRQDAIAISVTNSGVVSVATPAIEEFRSSYIFSVNEPTAEKTLTQYVLEKSNSAINLADLLEYVTDNGTSSSEGTCFLASDCDDNRLMSYQLNMAAGGYETYFIAFDMESGVDDVEFDHMVSLYPNPTSGKLFFTDELTDVEVFDLTGRKVYKASLAENLIDLSALHEGVYIVTAKADGKKIAEKISVVK